MRAPTPALIRARARAPLADLETLHLSDAGIECIKNVDACRRLRSLYADDNRLVSADGIAELPNLWRVDLNSNLLRDISALTAFRALGFLHLERNRLTFNQIACLRGMHVMELRLAGNLDIVGSGGGEHSQEYRKKVVALLPNVWILDGHYVSAMERELAIEQYEAHALSVLSASSSNNTSASNSSGPGVVPSASTAQPNAPACSMLWSSSGSSTFGIADQHENAAKMLDALRDEPERRFLHDLYRLRLIISFHNEEAAVHNAHTQFAANKRAPNTRNMSLVFLNDIQRLPRSARLAVTVLLTSYLRFRFDRALLVEALTIQLLESVGFPAQAIDDTAALPPYALSAITSVVRHQAIEEEDSMRRAKLPEAASAAFENECEVWRSLPPIAQTLLVDVGGDTADGREDRLRSEELISSAVNENTSIWSRRAVQLLSNASSFPELDGSAKSKKSSPSLASIVALLHAANSSLPGDSTHANCFDKTGIASFTVSVSTGKQREWRRDQQALGRPYPRPWASADGDRRCLSESQSAPLLDGANQGATAVSSSAGGHRRPRQGEWVEVRPKQFLKILHTSTDGSFVSAAPLSQPSDILTIAASQLARVSGNAWRVAGTAQGEHVEEFLSKMNAKASVDSFVGKLHRDSEGFHRHGAARNQGFPNYDVQAQHVVEAAVGDPFDSIKQPRPVGLFASNDTLDANYVLASPHAIAAQNYCATRRFTERKLAPAGLWRSIEHPSPFHVVAPSDAAGALEPPHCPKRATMRDLTAASEPSEPFERLDDWGDIKRQLQSVLGISTSRPSTSGGDNSTASDCATVFITSPASAADGAAPQRAGSPAEAPSPSSSRSHFPAAGSPAPPAPSRSRVCCPCARPGTPCPPRPASSSRRPPPWPPPHSRARHQRRRHRPRRPPSAFPPPLRAPC